eukprot:4670117-Amphidinium_carterae.1
MDTSWLALSLLWAHFATLPRRDTAAFARRLGRHSEYVPICMGCKAATVGLLSACAVIGIVSVGGLLFGATVKPRAFDKESLCHQES